MALPKLQARHVIFILLLRHPSSAIRHRRPRRLPLSRPVESSGYSTGVSYFAPWNRGFFIPPGSAISYQLSAISYQLSAISHQLSAISHQPSAISHQPSAIRYPLSAIGGPAAFLSTIT
jgi:hypothetical protein